MKFLFVVLMFLSSISSLANSYQWECSANNVSSDHKQVKNVKKLTYILENVKELEEVLAETKDIRLKILEKDDSIHLVAYDKDM